MELEARVETLEQEVELLKKANAFLSDLELIRCFKAVYIANPEFRRWLKNRILEIGSSSRP